MDVIFNYKEKIYEACGHIDDYNKFLGRTSMMPFRPLNSGSRAYMNGTHTEQAISLKNPETPTVATGNEDEFGINSTSYITAKENMVVVCKIPKFSFNQIHHYYLIVYYPDTGIYDVIERVSYNHNTEVFGYLWNNDYIDDLEVNSKVLKNQVIKTSIGFDKYGNKMNGVNLLTLYAATARNMEDSVIISESAAEKLVSPLILETDIAINDNDILVNLYGDNDKYKAFPDIGESIKNNILCGIRRVENDNALYSLSQNRLRDMMISDRNIFMEGTVVDIDVYCNNPDQLNDSYYNRQLYFYHQEKMRFCKAFYDAVAPIAMNNKLSHNLQKIYVNCRDAISGRLFYKNNQFNNVLMHVVVVRDLPVSPGDKLSDRYGGKGVISEILPDDQMPLLDDGRRVEIIKNQSTCINRENMGQLFEMSLSYISNRLIEAFKSKAFDSKTCCKMWYDFVSEVDKNQADEFASIVDFDDPIQAGLFIDCIFEDNRIMLSTPPFTSPVNIDTLARIYDKFPFIKPYKLMSPMEDSNGNIRYICSNRRPTVGSIYHYRLKQFGEEKFSVTSPSATNGKGLNTRSRANKIFEALYPKTPIMFGAMESGDLCHLGMDNVVMMLMLYSSSPNARKLFEQLLIGDPYNIDIRLDKKSKNRNAEIIKALLKTMGLELRFIKKPKEKKVMAYNVMCKTVSNQEHKPKTKIRQVMNNYKDELHMKYALAMMQKDTNPMVQNVMCKVVDKNDGNNKKTE